MLIPGLVLMGILFTVLGAYPFIERWITGDRGEHHLLERPRNQPTRTGFGVAGITAYGLLWAEGGNDLIAIKFHMSVETITWFMRVAIFVGPAIAFIIARRWAISLQRHDRDLLLHGYETGVIVRSPDGGYSELHAPINPERAYTLTTQSRHVPLELPETVDSNGVRAPQTRMEHLRARLSQFWFADEIQKPTVAELEEAAHHHTPDAPLIEDGHHAGIETGGQVGGDEFDLEETTTSS